MKQGLLQSETLVIGSGQAGTSIARLLAGTVNEDNILLFNTAKDILGNEDEVTVLKDATGSADGSGRNPLVTLERILPANGDFLRASVESNLKGKKLVVLISSLGGGSGSAISYYISKEILIPYKKENPGTIEIVQVLIRASDIDQNIVRKNEVPMMYMFSQLIGQISILPLRNDLLHSDSKSGGYYGNTNKNICDYIKKTFDFETFTGEIKENSLGTLDKNEFLHRGLSPANGFLSRASFPLVLLDSGDVKAKHLNTMVNELNVTTAKTVIIMFRSTANKPVSSDAIANLKTLFPNASMVFAESRIDEGTAEVEILANGIEVPQSLVDASNDAVKEALDLNAKKKESKGVNRASLKIEKARKSLFKL